MSRTLAASRRMILGAALGAAMGVGLVATPATAQTAKKDATRNDLLQRPKPLSQTLTGTAKADFDAAKLLANDGDFAGALIKFQSAYDAAKDPRLLWNVAFCQKNLRHYSKVVRTLKRYFDEGSALLSASDKKDAQDLITTIEPFTTRATVHVNQDGAQVFVDDELAGTSPLASAEVLDIGERRVRVTKEGFRPYERSIAIGGSADVTIEVALEKDVHEGKLIVDAPVGAAIFLDDKPVGVGKLEQAIPSGGHQLRVTAPGMRPYQTEVIVQDKETRSLNVVLEAMTSAEKPMLRIAVGCADSEPKGPEDGLVVYLDGPEVLPPGPVKKRWSDDLGKDVVEGVQYPVAAGPHVVKVSILGCRAREQPINVDPAAGADITGALESDRFVLVRGPQGSPGWFRAAAGLLWAGGEAQQSAQAGTLGYGTDGLGLTGVAVDVGIVDRWFGVYLDAGYAKGSAHRLTSDPGSAAIHYLLPDPATATLERLALRFGPRFPFNVVSLGFGPSFGIVEFDIDQVRTGKPTGMAGAFVVVDVQPLCDWGLFVMGGGEKSFNDDRVLGGVQAGVLFEPNSRCRRERATQFGLRAR